MADAKKRADADTIARKTFAKWLNLQIHRSAYRKQVKEVSIADLEEDLQDGEVLLHLVAATTGVPLPAKWERMEKGKRTPYRMNVNNDLMLGMAKTAKIKLVGIGAEDFTNKQTKHILGFLWTVIYNQQIGNIKGEEKTGKEGLRLWVQHSIKSREQDCGEVKNFTTSWTNGKILAALISAHAPDVLDYDKVGKNGTDLERIEQCIKIAEDQLGVAPLIDAPDMHQGTDDRSVITYLAELHKVFSERMPLATAQKRVNEFLQDQKLIDSFLWDYEEGTQAFCEFAEREFERISGLPPVSKEPGPDDLVPSQKRLDDSNRFNKATLASKRLAKRELEGLLASLQTILARSGRPAYKPSEKLSLERAQKLWDELTAAAEKEQKEVRAVYRKAREAVVSKYIEISVGLMNELEKVHADLTGVHGDEGEAATKLEKVKVLGEKLASLKKDVEACKETEGLLTAAKVNLDDVSGVDKSAADLESEHESLTAAVKREEKLIADQLAKAKPGESVVEVSNVEEVFNACDGLQKGSLTIDEFRNALLAFGYLPDGDIDEVFGQYAKKGHLTLEDFAKIVNDLLSQKSGEGKGPDVFTRAIQSICGGEVSLEKLKEAIGAADAEYLWSKGESQEEGTPEKRLAAVFSNTARVGQEPPRRTAVRGRQRGISMRTLATESPLCWPDED